MHSIVDELPIQTTITNRINNWVFNGQKNIGHVIAKFEVTIPNQKFMLSASRTWSFTYIVFDVEWVLNRYYTVDWNIESYLQKC